MSQQQIFQNMKSIQIFIFWESEPSQLVYTFAKQSKIPFEVKEISLNKGDHRSPEYLKINPFHQVPSLHDPNTGLTISQSHSIIRYLSDQYQFYGWLPKDFVERARIDQYLDWHHTNTRMIANYHILKEIAPMKGIETPYKEKETFEFIVETIKNINDIWLANGKKFLCSESQLSAADYSCYLELCTMANHFKFDLSEYKNIVEWKKQLDVVPEILEVQQKAKEELENFLKSLEKQE